MAPRAEVGSARVFKHLESQPALSALHDTKGVSGALATRPLHLVEPLSTEQPKTLSERANDAMDLWFSTLSYKERGKPKMLRSHWGRHGGTIALGVRHGKTARRHQKLKRERPPSPPLRAAFHNIRLGVCWARSVLLIVGGQTCGRGITASKFL
jgi:hypothetical protein